MGIETATATILVTDVVASTALRVSLGEVRADALRRDLDAAQAEAVGSHGGSVVKGLGDGVLAVFPGAAEGVAAGIAVQQAADTIAHHAGVDLAVRVGISAGDVSVEDGDCFGTPVVEASRLCAIAAGGQVLAADVVRVLARGRGGHVFDRHGPVELKGLPEPVEAWSVAWSPVAAGTGLRQGSPYVGRERERAVVRDLLDFARAGHGGTVLVAGEPGIGKSRFVTEVCREAAGVQVLWGGCHHGDVTPVAAITEAVTEWARRTDREVVRAAAGPDGPVLATMAPALREIIAELPAAPVIPPDEAADRLQDALCQWLDRLAATAPVVFVLDDLHWADDTTVRLLRSVARSAKSRRLLVIGTYRETDLDRSHPLAEALPVLRREVEPTRIALDGLDAGEVGDLLRLMAGHDVPAAFAQLLVDQCNGNPFFIRETLLHLWEEGRIAQEDGTWVATTTDLGIPEGVREVIGRRLARLSPTANRLLAVGALFEVAFPLPVLCDVAGVGDDEALDAVDEALAAQIIRPAGELDAYAFTHALFRHTLVGELNPSRQVRSHRAIAEAIEKRLRGEPSPADAAILARHYWRSAVLPGAERGVAYALRAAEHAEVGAAFREAYDLYVMARDLLEPGDEREVDLQRGLTTAAVLAQMPVDDLVADATRLGDLVAATTGDDAAADAGADLASIANSLDEVTTTWRLAAVARRRLRPDRRDGTWLRLRSFELGERVATDPSGVGLALDTPEQRELFELVWATTWTLDYVNVGSAGLGSIPERAVLRRLLDVATTPWDQTSLRFHGGDDVAAMVASAGEAFEEALAIGRLALALLMTSMRVRGLLALGEHDEADRRLAEGMSLVPRISERSTASLAILVCLPFAGWARGAPLGLGQIAQSGVVEDRVADPNTRFAGVAISAGLAYTSAWVDADVAAIDEVAALLPAIEGAAGWAPNYPMILHLAVGAHWWLERVDHLAVLARNLDDKVLARDQGYLETDGRWVAARVASLEGRHADARRWFDAAVARFTANGAVGLLPAVHHDAALAESRAGAAGDPIRFTSAVAAARAGASHPSMAAWVDRLDRLVAPPG